MKKVVIAILLLLVGLILCLVFGKANVNKEQATNKEMVQISQFNIDGRTTLITSDYICVGNNIKELENNFYDIKIVNKNNQIDIYLNKLWYETYGNDYIQDDYLAKICRELSKKINVDNNTEQFEYVLYKYIKDNYVEVRQYEQPEAIMTEDYNLKFELEDNIVKLIIQRGS